MRDSLLIFAYGSNLLTSRLKQRAADALKVCRANLLRYRLCFRKKGADGSGKADVAYTGLEIDRVEGVVFEIGRSDVEALDLAEFGYDRVQVEVISGNDIVIKAEAYRARASAIDDALRPFDWYMALIEAGAREHGLSEDYRIALNTVARVPDQDVQRRSRHQALLR